MSNDFPMFIGAMSNDTYVAAVRALVKRRAKNHVPLDFSFDLNELLAELTCTPFIMGFDRDEMLTMREALLDAMKLAREHADSEKDQRDREMWRVYFHSCAAVRDRVKRVMGHG